MTLDSLVVDIEYPTTARLVCGVPPFSCYWPKAENAGGLGAEPPGLLQNRVFDIARVVLVPEMPLRRPRMKLPMPQIKLHLPRMMLHLPQIKRDLPQMKLPIPRIKLDMPQVKRDMRRIKHDLPRIKLDLPQMKLDLPQMKRDMPRMKLELPHLKLRMARLKLRMARLKPRMPHLKLGTEKKRGGSGAKLDTRFHLGVGSRRNARSLQESRGGSGPERLQTGPGRKASCE